jgi:putative transcriptional regulator
MEELRVEAGTLLAAWPDMRDPNFMHAVVLVCQHGEEGAYGLVLNRPTEFAVHQLLPDHPTLGEARLAVHCGGPVDHTSMQFVHRAPKRVPGGIPLANGLYLGGELEALGRYLTADPDAAERDVRVFVGYSGWGAGQLETELGTGSWLPVPFQIDAVFSTDAAATWRRVVRSAGGPGRVLADLPPDVSWN